MSDTALRIACHLGASSVELLEAEVEAALRDHRGEVIIEVVAFDYFDEAVLNRFSRLVDAHPGRVTIKGLDDFAAALLDPPAAGHDSSHVGVDALNRLESVAILNAAKLDHDDWTDALAMASDTASEPDCTMLVIDLQDVMALAPSQLVGISELSGELEHNRRTLVIVNASAATAEALKNAGMSSNLWLSLV